MGNLKSFSKIVLRAYIFGVNLVKIGLVVIILDKASDIHRDVPTFKLGTNNHCFEIRRPQNG